MPERLELDDDEISVLNHVLHSLTERPDFAELVADPADRQALHNLLAVVEREDNIVFSPDYDTLLNQARQRVLTGTDDLPL